MVVITISWRRMKTAEGDDDYFTDLEISADNADNKRSSEVHGIKKKG